MRIDRAKLIYEMAKANLNNNELAKLAGISRVTVSSIRSGKSCNEVTAAKIAKILGNSIFEVR